MDTGQDPGSGKYDRWARQEDEELVEVLRTSTSQEDTNVAMQILHDRYQAEVKGRVYQTVQAPGWVDEVVEKIWVDFYLACLGGNVRENVSGLLFCITRNKCADYVRETQTERAIEQSRFDFDEYYDDKLYIAKMGQSPEEIVDRQDEELEELREIQARQDLLRHFPYMHSIPISDCKRVLWVLRRTYGYRSKAVARLLGKSVSLIDKVVSQATRDFRNYYASEAFELTLAQEKLPQLWEPARLQEDVTVIERFAEPFNPALTPEELKPLGLTNEELRENYWVSLVLPRWFDAYGGLATTPPSLLLTRKPDWDEMKKLFERLAQDPSDLPDEFAEECMVRVDVEKNDILLRVEPMLQIIPEDPDEPLYSDTVLALHSHHLKIPVVFGFYASSEYTPDLLARWPFVTPDMGLE